MKQNPYILLAAATLFWAGNSVAGKMAVGHVSPMFLNAIRWGVVMVILGLAGRREIAMDWAVIRQRKWYLLAMGAIGFTLFSAALYSALLYTSATNASIEQGGIPLLVFIFSYLLYGTRTTLAQLGGFVISFIGIVLTATHGAPGRLLQLDVNYGDALMIVAILTYGFYTAALRRKPQLHWMSLMVALCAGAFASALPFLWAEAASGALILPDATGWAIIVYVVLFPSLLSQITYIRGVELIGANRAGLFINLLPVWGAFLAVVVLGEDFQTYHAIALVLVLSGVLIAEYDGRRRAASAP
ncbi:DMT family transporter [Aquamicrobium defluvii]|uniref:Drug/metabolite transporter (DMT)-like permease n=1 Tax=Aquamicrobium defluvii TaxID=69279 RepID=A0A011UWZ5_9HYPH|nr:DMT family transporter [Aquamicrobium defluvii]EXL10383.1 membrane protein [Aquamicrobium defluvii]EZQ17560.1 membrane protein [Halopseudomonas bauzanensis]TDR37179.1 drug/metabolite transporter (DMT)-like permease [Aquamicrobium defluvii]